MKQRFSFLFAVLCGILLLASCHRGPDYARMIPSDAVMVMDMQLEQLYKKGDLKHADELSMMKMLRQELGNESDASAAKINDLLDNPEQTGLDLMGDVVLYADESSNVVLLMPMRSQRKFEKFLASLVEDEELQIEKQDGFKQLKGLDALPFGLCWDKEKVALTVRYDGDQAQLMKLDKKASMDGNKDFRAYWKKRGDMSFWYDAESFLSMLNNTGLSAEMGDLSAYTDMMKGVSYCADVNFEKGLVRTVIKTFGIDKNSEMMKFYNKKMNSKLMDFMPEPCFVGLTLSAAVDQMLPYWDKMGSSAAWLDEEIVGGTTVRDLMTCIDGSLAANLYGFGTTDEGSLLPLFAAAVDLKDAAKVRSMLTQLKLEQSQEDLWVVPGLPLYIGMKKDVLFVTDELATAQTAMGKGFKNGMKAVAKKAKKGNYLFADLGIDRYPDVVKVLMNKDLIVLLRSYLDYTECVSTSETEGEYVLYLADKKQNSLAATIHFVDDNLLRFGSLFSSLSEGLGKADDYDFELED